MDEITQFRKDLLEKVSRMESMEEEFGIKINRLSIITEPDNDGVNINFEVTSISGKKLKDDIEIHFAFYDNNGFITCKDSIYIDSDRFKGFSIESTYCDLHTEARNINRIVCYPSKY